MTDQPPTMSDVARRAGVSRQLVSLVLRGEPGPSAASRETVLAAAAELDFHVNASARLLRQPRTQLIGVLFAVSNLFEARFVEHLADQCRAAGLGVVLGPMTEHRTTDVVLSELLSLRVEALACFNPDPESAALGRAIERVPVVWLGERATRYDVDAVRSDDDTGMRLVIEHLAALGHREIAYAGGTGGQVGPDRAQAYRDAMTRNGLAARVDQVDVGFGEEDGATAARTLLARDRLPHAVACASDQVAAGLMTVLRFAGVQVPQDVSVVGYDDSAFMSCTDPPLTTVRQPIEAIGRAAVELLVGQIEGAAVSTDELFFEPEIVARGSTAAARVTLAPA